MDRMDFRAYLTALRRYWWVALLTTVLGVAGAGVAYRLTPPTYASTVTFYVGTPTQNGINPQSSNAFAEARVNSYVVLISSERVAEAVIQRTGVDLTPAQVMTKMSAEAELNTVVVQATVSDDNQARAATLARGLADTFGQTVSRLDNPGTGRDTVVVNVVTGPADLGAVAPRLKIYGALGLLAGLVVGLVLIILRELLDNTVRTPEAASALVGAPALGNIGFDPDARRTPLLLGRRATSLQAESVRQLRTNLTFVDVDHPTRVLVVTSSAPAEGKTSLCANLALSMAEAGHRVLVVEGDLRRPRLATLLGLESEIGLTNVLIGQVTLSQALQQWTPKVSVLTSGSLPPNPSELLEGQRIKRLLTDLRPHFDKILIDTTPLLPVTDAAVAASLGDGVVMVVRSGKTSRDQVSTAVSSLRAVNAEVIGVVLNMRRRRRQEKRAYSYKGLPSSQVDWSVLADDAVSDKPAADTAAPDERHEVFQDGNPTVTTLSRRKGASR